MAVAGAALFLAGGPAAWADNSCVAYLAAKANAAKATAQDYNIELTMHREGIKLVSYSEGWLSPRNDGSFSGAANQLFSDRLANYQQPFDIHQADSLTLGLSPTGVLQIHYSPWNFDTSWDLSCKGSVMTTYLPGVGVVTLTLRELFYPIP